MAAAAPPPPPMPHAAGRPRPRALPTPQPWPAQLLRASCAALPPPACRRARIAACAAAGGAAAVGPGSVGQFDGGGGSLEARFFGSSTGGGGSSTGGSSTGGGAANDAGGGSGAPPWLGRLISRVLGPRAAGAAGAAGALAAATLFNHILLSNIISCSALTAAWIRYRAAAGASPLAPGHAASFAAFYAGLFVVQQVSRPLRLAAAAIGALAARLGWGRGRTLAALFAAQAVALLAGIGGALVLTGSL
jgi:hypothetical protein